MRFSICVFALAAICIAADNRESVTVRGKLTVREGKPASLETTDRQTVQLDGDDSTLKVLADGRLNGFEIQAKGKFTGPGRFTIDPIHTRSLLVQEKGHLKLVTYWCDICAIRAYTPGPCACCQRETTLDLRDPEHLDGH
jgi:hypothetical protein